MPGRIRSCPSRGTWIEISLLSANQRISVVVPLTGHVDRNICEKSEKMCTDVVPLTGHVDRNCTSSPTMSFLLIVVPLTGHVDRNLAMAQPPAVRPGSCPSRGTWIEMAYCRAIAGEAKVVPLTGHVDRNTAHAAMYTDNPCRAPHGARG